MKKKSNVNILIFLLIIIQSCGIRFFGGQGSLLMAIIILLSINCFKLISGKDILFLFSALSYLFLNKLINPTSFDSSKLIYQAGLVLEALFLVVSYRRYGVETLINDFYKILKLTFIYAITGYCLYILLSGEFTRISYAGYKYLTFGYLFYVDAYGRNTGYLWEPGLLQLMLNLYLFFSLKRQKSFINILFIVIAILSTRSTTGYIILCINFIYFLYNSYTSKRLSLISLIFISLVASTGSFIIQENLSSKFDEENTSSLVRYRDYLIGCDLIKEKPLFGHGLFSEQYLAAKTNIRSIESDVFTEGYLDLYGDLSGGYTNGLLGVFCWFGIPIGLLIFRAFYFSKILSNVVIDRLVFFLNMSLTFLSEPITYTAFFLIFPFSYFLFKDIEKSDHLNKPNANLG